MLGDFYSLDYARTWADWLDEFTGLHVFGYTAYAYMWALMARTALAKQGEDDFYASKLGTARFYFARLLPRIHSLSASVRAGSESLYLLDAEQF